MGYGIKVLLFKSVAPPISNNGEPQLIHHIVIKNSSVDKVIFFTQFCRRISLILIFTYKNTEKPKNPYAYFLFNIYLYFKYVYY